jgi:hypothetical protein
MENNAMKPIRKCTRLVNSTEFDCRRNVRVDALIHEYGNLFQRYLDEGWEPYLITFAFNQLPGSSSAKREQMKQAVMEWYSRLASRTVKKPRSPIQAQLLPIGVFVPDLPVAKRSKHSLREVSVNDGLHFHGKIVANRCGRISEPLDVHIKANLDTYLLPCFRTIDIQPVTHTLQYATDYAMKGLKRSAFSLDDILILPRTLNELTDQNRRRPGDFDASTAAWK